MPDGAKFELIGPGCRLAVSEPDVIDHELAVDRIGDGLPHLLIVERRLLGVDHQLHHRADHLVALGGHLDAGQGRQLLGVVVGHGAEACDVRLALLYGGRARRLVVDEAHHDAVEIGQTLAPVVRVLVETHQLAAPPFDELERSGADRLVGVGVGLDVALAEHMLGQHRALVARKCGQHVGRGVGQLEDSGMLVGCLHCRDIAEGADAARMRLLQHVHDRELHVGGRERLAVVKLHFFAQLEGDGLAVGRDFPGLGERGLGLEVEAVFEQPVIDLGGDLADGGGSGNVGRQVGRFGLRDLHQRAAGLLRQRRRTDRCHGSQAERSNQTHRNATHNPPPGNPARRMQPNRRIVEGKAGFRWRAKFADVIPAVAERRAGTQGRKLDG